MENLNVIVPVASTILTFVVSHVLNTRKEIRLETMRNEARREDRLANRGCERIELLSSRMAALYVALHDSPTIHMVQVATEAWQDAQLYLSKEALRRADKLLGAYRGLASVGKGDVTMILDEHPQLIDELRSAVGHAARKAVS